MYIQKRHKHKIVIISGTILAFFCSTDHMYAMKHVAEDQTDGRAPKRAAPSSLEKAAPEDLSDSDGYSTVSEPIVPFKMREDDDPDGLTDALSSIEGDENNSYSDASNLSDDRYDGNASNSSYENAQEKASTGYPSESDGSEADDEEIFSKTERKKTSSHKNSDPKTDEAKSS